ncbi:Mitochondrial carrier protein-like protein [Venustampulla echinocandica]|uniref:Mitochondrial carrier protein-like protein n=1 Tax=Venustampulla echinocandica TaxID=2656787 RepID=A0A370U3A3_9HELO|nr:Mitochondrial carrier protein-like protein [Venustampulla echinocandica]RDL42266.1 Mitochondrial carrier protein-like protein [Venustampulla echinocandica]
MSNTHTDILLSPDYNKFYYDASKKAINRRVLFRGLYQGVGSVILVTIPSSWFSANSGIAGAFFTTYEAVKSQLTKANKELGGPASPLIPQPFINSAASSAAELVSCFILTPAEVLKQNAQMVRKTVVSSASRGSAAFQPSVTLQTLKRFKTPSQLWSGYTALAARNLPYTAMQFPMYEHMRAAIKKHRKEHGKSTGSLLETALITAVSAGTAGSIAAFLTTPVDVVKTRIMLSAAGEGSENNSGGSKENPEKQNQSASNLASKKAILKKSELSIAREIFNTSGIKGLFRGAVLRAVWTILGSGLYLSVYEGGRVWLERETEDDQEDQ